MNVYYNCRVNELVQQPGVFAAASDFDGAEPAGDEVDSYGRSLLEAQPPGLAGQCRCWNGQQFRMRAVTYPADVSAGAPDLGADPVLRSGEDHAGEVAPGDPGKGRSLHVAGDICQV